MQSITGVTAATYDFSIIATTDVKVELWAVRSGIDSYQKHIHQFYLDSPAVTAVLLHFNGSNGSTSIVDSSSAAKTFTVSGNAQLTTTDPKLGTACLTLDGSGDWVQTVGHPHFVLGTFDFTIECFVKTTDNNFSLIDFYGSNGWQVFVNASGKLAFYAGATLAVTSTASVNTGSWVHIAVTRQGTALKLWVNGVLDGSVTNSVNMNTQSAYLAIGAQVNSRNAAYDLSGQVDEVRIRKGEALYSANFTPPTVELT